MKNIFECNICYSSYDSSVKIPVSLSCGHVFCKVCMEKYPNCPVDKVPHAAISTLPCCYAILCNLPKPLPVIACCPKHMNKKIKYKCSTHETYLCSECIINHSGGSHELTLFTINLKQIEEDLKELASVSECVVSDAKEALSGCKQQIKKLNRFYEEQFAQVDSVFDNAIELMNVKRKEFLDKLKSTLKEQQTSIELNKSKWYKSLWKAKEWAKELGGYHKQFDKVSYEEFNKYLASTYEEVTGLSDYKINDIDLKYYGYNEKLNIADFGNIEIMQYRGPSWTCLRCTYKNEEKSSFCSICSHSRSSPASTTPKNNARETKAAKPRHRKKRKLHKSKSNNSL